MNASSNPFASRFIRPGAIPYLAHDGRSPQSLAAEFLQSPSSMLAIVGPHGSGKSTLLHALLPFLGRLVTIDNVAPSELSLPSQTITSGHPIHFFRLHADQSPSPQLWKCIATSGPQDILVIDGFEQLKRLQIWWLLFRVRQRGARLLITSHQPIASIPTWIETRVDQAVEAHVLLHLVGDTQWMESESWMASRQRWGQNLRESLMDLYDQMELQHA